jgi:hypothetical protein
MARSGGTARRKENVTTTQFPRRLIKEKAELRQSQLAPSLRSLTVQRHGERVAPLVGAGWPMCQYFAATDEFTLLSCFAPQGRAPVEAAPCTRSPHYGDSKAEWLR